MSRGNKKSCSPVEACDLFAEFFESVYVTDDESSWDLSKKMYPIEKRAGIGLISFVIEDVLNHLRNIDTNVGEGPEYISPLLQWKLVLRVYPIRSSAFFSSHLISLGRKIPDEVKNVICDSNFQKGI